MVDGSTNLLARARYNNRAETEDELTFRQGDVVTVLKKDFNQQRDWWLCELRGKVGMVPANYLEIFHEQSTYDVPKPSKSSSVSPGSTPVPQISSKPEADNIYDLPPTDVEIIDRDYDLPPPEASHDEGVDYDRPPSANRLSPMGSNRSSMKSANRISVGGSSVASSRNSSSIYDVPPDMMDTYDLPKPHKGGEVEEKEAPLLAVDTSTMYDDEAEELLASYRQLMTATYDVLFQTVYGPEAYWGNENKAKRMVTLKQTLQAVKHFDRALVALLEFGKGVVNALGNTSDANFKKKYSSAFTGLMENRAEILAKVEQLSSEIDSITATVKSLLEVARAIPKAVTEFTVLVNANKALLFKIRNTSTTSLPVITKSDLKVRPLPERPPQVADVRKSDDYAIPVEAPSLRRHKTPEKNYSDSNIHDTNTVNRRRKPNDHLPPLPHAPQYGTMPKRPPKKVIPEQIPRSSSPFGNEISLTTSARQGSPMLIHRSEDYDEINDKIRDRSVVLNKRPSLASLNSGSSRDASPTHVRRRREQSLSSCSGSSEEMSGTALRRVNSADILDGPYGRPNGHLVPHHVRQTSSPQPLRDEDKELLDRFSKQLDLIIPSLRETVDVFIVCLKDNEPPLDFVTKSKLTVVAAYKLVYIADALTQKILHAESKSTILAASNQLTDSIKNLVSSTKTAALQYPSVIAKDSMTESLRVLLPAALDLINSVKTRASFA